MVAMGTESTSILHSYPVQPSWPMSKGILFPLFRLCATMQSRKEEAPCFPSLVPALLFFSLFLYFFPFPEQNNAINFHLQLYTDAPSFFRSFPPSFALCSSPCLLSFCKERENKAIARRMLDEYVSEPHLEWCWVAHGACLDYRHHHPQQQQSFILNSSRTQRLSRESNGIGRGGGEGARANWTVVCQHPHCQMTRVG